MLQPIAAVVGRRRGFNLDKTPVHRRATTTILEAPASLACVSVNCGRKPEHQEMNPRQQWENMPPVTAPPYKTRFNTKQNKTKKDAVFPLNRLLFASSAVCQRSNYYFPLLCNAFPRPPLPCQRRGKITKPHVCGGAVIL